MGCGASKTAVVAPEQAPSKPPEPLNASYTASPTQNVKLQQRKAQPNEALQSSSSSTLASESEVTSLGSRNSSATSGKSKGSSSSGDSGLGEEIIMEKSDEALREVANVSSELEPPALSIDGLPAGKTNISKHESKKVKQIDSNEELPQGLKHVKFAEKLIGELPDSPSILKRPVSRGGMAFDVSVGDSLSPQMSAQMPAFSSNSRRKQRPSYQELQEKQRVAEQRKKEHKQMIIERIRAKEERDRQVKEALAKFAEMQTELTTIKQKKQKVSSQNREADLKSPRDDLLKEKSTHVEEVKTAKKAKQLVPLNRPPRSNTGTQNKPVSLGAN